MYYLKQHIEQHHNVRCERGDAQVLTKPLLDKISQSIQQADVIVADCSGRNPNVFYELGMAHAYEKKVILIVREDEKSELPVDIRPFEFIPYGLNRHIEFFDRLDNALANALGGRHDQFFERAREIFEAFKRETGALAQLASKEKFVADVILAERRQEIPPDDDPLKLAEFVLPRITANYADLAVMQLIVSWLSKLSTS